MNVNLCISEFASLHGAAQRIDWIRNFGENFSLSRFSCSSPQGTCSDDWTPLVDAFLSVLEGPIDDDAASTDELILAMSELISDHDADIVLLAASECSQRLASCASHFDGMTGGPPAMRLVRLFAAILPTLQGLNNDEEALLTLLQESSLVIAELSLNCTVSLFDDGSMFEHELSAHLARMSRGVSRWKGLAAVPSRNSQGLRHKSERTIQRRSPLATTCNPNHEGDDNFDTTRRLTMIARTAGQISAASDLKSLMFLRRLFDESLAVDGVAAVTDASLFEENPGRIRPVPLFRLQLASQGDPSFSLVKLTRCVLLVLSQTLKLLLSSRFRRISPDRSWRTHLCDIDEIASIIILILARSTSSVDRECHEAALTVVFLALQEYDAILAVETGTPSALITVPTDDESPGSPDVFRSMFVILARGALEAALGADANCAPRWEALCAYLRGTTEIIKRCPTPTPAFLGELVRGLLPVLASISASFYGELDVSSHRFSSPISLALLHLTELLNCLVLSSSRHLDRVACEALLHLLVPATPTVFSGLIVSLAREVVDSWNAIDGAGMPQMGVIRACGLLIDWRRAIDLLLRDPARDLRLSQQNETRNAFHEFFNATTASLTFLLPGDGAAMKQTSLLAMVQLQSSVLQLAQDVIQTADVSDSSWAIRFSQILLLALLQNYLSEDSPCLSMKSQFLGHQGELLISMLRTLRSLVSRYEDVRSYLISALGIVEILAAQVDLEVNVGMRRRGESRRSQQVFESFVRSAPSGSFIGKNTSQPGVKPSVPKVTPTVVPNPTPARPSVVRPAIPKLSLGGVPPPIYFTSNGDTAEAASALILKSVTAPVGDKIPEAKSSDSSSDRVSAMPPSELVRSVVDDPHRRTVILDSVKHSEVTVTLNASEMADKIVYSRALLDSDKSFLTTMRSTRWRIYSNPHLHAEWIVTLARTLLSKDGLVDPAAATPFAVQNPGFNNPMFTLQEHLRDEENKWAALRALNIAREERDMASLTLLTFLVPSFDLSTVVIGALLGTGAFGAVHACDLITPSSAHGSPHCVALAAMKRVAAACHPTDRINVIDLHNETMIMLRNQDLPGICQVLFTGNSQGEQHVLIMRRYTSNLKTNLASWKRSADSNIAMKCLQIFLQALDVVVSLHSRNIAHLDIKAENWFVSADDGLILGDFGCATYVAPAMDRERLNRGTECIRAPELFSSGARKVADPLLCDVWSLGCLLFEVVTGSFLFHEANEGLFSQHMERITRDHMPLLSPSSEAALAEAMQACSDAHREAVRSIIHAACHRNPLHRLSAARLRALCTEWVLASTIGGDVAARFALPWSVPTLHDRSSLPSPDTLLNPLGQLPFLAWDIAIQDNNLLYDADQPPCVVYPVVPRWLNIATHARPTFAQLLSTDDRRSRPPLTHVLGFTLSSNDEDLSTHFTTCSLFPALCDLHPELRLRGLPNDEPPPASREGFRNFCRAVLGAVDFLQSTRTSGAGCCTLLPFIVEEIDMAFVLTLCFASATFGVSTLAAAAQIGRWYPPKDKANFVLEILAADEIVQTWNFPEVAQVRGLRERIKVAQCLCGRCVYPVHISSALEEPEMDYPSELTVFIEDVSKLFGPEAATMWFPRLAEPWLVRVTRSGAPLDINSSWCPTSNWCRQPSLDKEGPSDDDRISDDVDGAGPEQASDSCLDLGDVPPASDDSDIDESMKKKGSIFYCRVCKMPTHIARGSDLWAVSAVVPVVISAQSASDIEVHGVDLRKQIWNALNSRE